MRDPNDEIGKAMAKALSEKVKAREERPARGKPEREGSPRWTPPRCARRGCSNPADVNQRDFEANAEDEALHPKAPKLLWFCKENGYQCAKWHVDQLHGKRGRFKEAPPGAPISPEEAEDA